MKKLLFIILLFTIIACNNSSTYRYTEEQIASLWADSADITPITNNIEPTLVDLSEFIGDSQFNFTDLVDTAKLIFLDNEDDESLIGMTGDFHIKNDYIYVIDVVGGNNVVIFDKNGHFVRRLERGNGPGEICNMYSWGYNDIDSQMVIHQNQSLLFYTADGNFIKDEIVPFAFQDFMCTDTGYIFYQRMSMINQHLHAHEKNAVIITDKQYRIQTSTIPLTNHIAIGNSNNNLRKLQDEITITKSMCDTIYSLKNGEINPKYILELGSSKIPNSLVQDESMMDLKNVEKNVLSTEYVRFTGEYLETSTHLLFRIYQGNKYYVIYCDKHTNHQVGGYTVNWNSFDFPNTSSPHFISEDWFIVPVIGWVKGCKFSNRFISEEDNQKISNLDEDSNPVIFMFKLKNF